ncbi:hypothetical protein AURDEDRAFT_69685 [Auricularia subglabra TFB-10046 SS5]|nr:hypothetical protein AURDEDRAFT_69685 [Auricularia subglabra TFB-10046 SS5]
MKVGADVSRVELSNEGLGGVQHFWGDPKVEVAPDGTRAYKAFYPKYSYSKSTNPGIGGFGFGFTGPLDFLASDEILFSYAVWFPKDFEFVMGGKLPGPFGGADPQSAAGCSGGRQVNRDDCFSLRLMWREDGAGEIYAYVPPDPANDHLLDLEGSETDPTIYGLSIARGAFHFARGNWTVVAQRIKLNTFGKADGEIELWANGKSVIHATGVVLRAVETTKIRGIEAETFFGGGSPPWQTPKDQVSYMAGFSAALLGPRSSPADGRAPYPLKLHNNSASVRDYSSRALMFAIAGLVVTLLSL